MSNELWQLWQLFVVLLIFRFAPKPKYLLFNQEFYNKEISSYMIRQHHRKVMDEWVREWNRTGYRSLLK
jgi:hypothetical protein